MSGERGVDVDELLALARARLERVGPQAALRAQRDGALLVDIRPVEQRLADGEIAGAVVIDRNVLEWRLDPRSPDRIAEATDAGLHIILICHEGYSSSLAAATLQDLGLHRATDLEGGVQAWKAARLPLVPAAVTRTAAGSRR